MLASGFASGAAQDGNVREEKRRIVVDGTGKLVAVPEPDTGPFTKEDLEFDAATLAFVKYRLTEKENNANFRDKRAAAKANKEAAAPKSCANKV